ncbi:D-alanyl-D-alanine carboxypeptidase family protein [Zavarzinia aquatilis]|uniref:D-alanyl-D-alanine carboxypeptidase n=1 Tax=Zavarzinia aquatilis TaxID=2211142 RepID=A0A317EDC0_9PROT|nr:D-alanyl-D-alanine carboxypeptidase family protein [Zavarzinia aquatilis]PWR24919.1 D-alanyl-D-alanine carboxypeptidase [Zavarzinia aquatilis]
MLGTLSMGRASCAVGIATGSSFRAADRRRQTLPVLSAAILVLAMVFAALIAPRLAFAGPAYSVVILDADTGRVILSDSPSAQRHPASLTKMMTLYMTFDALKAGTLTLDQRLTVSANAASRPATKLGLRPGQTIAVKDAIMSLITLSANDMSVVLAEAIGGTEDVFASRMTARAHELGMSSTFFHNANGLPDDAQVTSAYDMAKLGLALMRDHPTYYPMFSVQKWRYGGKVITNHNRMLGRYEGTNGIKTGYIRASGFNLVVSVKRGGVHLVGAIFGGSSAKARDDHMIELLDAAFVRLQTKPELVAAAEVVRPNAVSAPTRAFAAAPAPAPADVALAAAALDAKIADANPADDGEEAAAEAAYATPPVVAKPAPARPAAVAAAPPAIVPARPAAPTTVAALAPAGTLGAQADRARERATSGETWGVQIGAFRRQDAAVDHLNDAMRVAASSLRGAQMAVHQGTDDKGTIYRARFVGLSENGARDACMALRKKSLSCIALKVPSTVTASAGAAN